MSSTFKQWVKATAMTLSPCIYSPTLKYFRISVLNAFAVAIVSHKSPSKWKS